MSHFTTIEVEFADQDCLIRALEQLVPKWKGCIEVHTTAESLYGYHGDVRPQKAHIIIRRKNISSASNDIGFEKQANGKYKAYISEYDATSQKYDKNWMGRLKQAYAAEKVMKEACNNGYNFINPNRKIEIQKDGKKIIKMVDKFFKKSIEITVA